MKHDPHFKVEGDWCGKDKVQWGYDEIKVNIIATKLPEGSYLELPPENTVWVEEPNKMEPYPFKIGTVNDDDLKEIAFLAEQRKIKDQLAKESHCLNACLEKLKYWQELGTPEYAGEEIVLILSKFQMLQNEKHL